MIRSRAARVLLMAVAPGLVASACSDSGSPVDPNIEATVFLSVVPRGGATGVDRFAPVFIEFDHELMDGMQAFALLHEGSVTGPEVDGTWTLSPDRLSLRFTPSEPLSPDATYTIHLGGGMEGMNGQPVDFDEHGDHMGGAWATDATMRGTMAGGGMMGGAMGGDHMGSGWQHATNGSYGMVFSFTTGR